MVKIILSIDESEEILNEKKTVLQFLNSQTDLDVSID